MAAKKQEGPKYQVGQRVIIQLWAQFNGKIVKSYPSSLGPDGFTLYDVEVPFRGTTFRGISEIDLYEDHYDMLLRQYGRYQAKKYGRKGWEGVPE